MRHVRNAFLGIVDGLDDCGCEFFEVVRETIFLRRCFTVCGAGFGVAGDAAIRVEAADGAVAFLKDTATFFDQGLDVLDKLFFVKLLFGSAVGFFDVLLNVSGLFFMQDVEKWKIPQ